MILEESKRSLEVVGEQTTTSKMHISHDVESHIIKILTEYSYRDPLGSLIRENISNNIDSIKEARVETPAILKMYKNPQNNWQLDFIDEGLGLDDIEFNKYIMGIGESTKRGSNEFLGGLTF